jgi:AraC family transcriptional regulator
MKHHRNQNTADASLYYHLDDLRSHHAMADYRESRPASLVLGKLDKRWNIPGFVLTETFRPAGLTLEPHYHEHANISFALAGAFEETIGARSHQVTPFDLILRPAGEKHANRYLKGSSRSLIIEVASARLPMIRETTDVLETAGLFRTKTFSSFGRRIYREFTSCDSFAALSIESLILELLVESSRQLRDASQRAPQWLLQVRDLLHDEISTTWTLLELATLVGHHPAHLARAFRNQFGCTVGEYVRKLRADEAMELLQQTERPIADIAVSLGFYDQSHFTHFFQLQTGMTPKAFRVRSWRKAGTKTFGFSKNRSNGTV